MLVSTLRFSATTSCSLPAREQSMIFSTNCEQQQQQYKRQPPLRIDVSTKAQQRWLICTRQLP
jgi:hypothetical protein